MKKLFKKDGTREAFDKGIIKGREEKEKELIPLHRKELEELYNEKEIEIAELKAENASMERRCEYWQGIYKQEVKNRIQNKIDRKEITKAAEDMQYFLDQEIIKNENVVSAFFQTLGKFTGKQLTEGK